MSLYNNPQIKVRSILRKIEIGKASESNMADFAKLLDNQPHIVPEAIEGLNAMLQKGDIEIFNSAILALNKISENYLGLEYYSVDAIIGCMQKRKKDLNVDSLLRIFNILLKITEKYPERMRIAVPELLMCLENMSVTIREKAYFILAILAITHHEFFIGRSKEIIRVLNGLNLDERVYVCRLIRIIAEKEQIIVADTYDILEDFHLNHPDNNLRREASYAIEKLKEEINLKPSDALPVITVKKSNLGSPIKSETGTSNESFSELSGLMEPDERDIINMLEGMGLKHLIVNKAIVKNWRNTEYDYILSAME